MHREQVIDKPGHVMFSDVISFTNKLITTVVTQRFMPFQAIFGQLKFPLTFGCASCCTRTFGAHSTFPPETSFGACSLKTARFSC